MIDKLITTPKHKDLIYDIGMHTGQDTEFYLRKGFRVIAFEANPDLVSACSYRFKKFIDQGKLTIVEGAIVDLKTINADQQKIQFYRNDDISVWGTVLANWSERNAQLGTSSSIIEVNVVDFAGVIQEYGVPHFMKIDIEGCDMVCVNTLKLFSERPDYISVESDKTSFSNVQREINLLADLGYNFFQAVEQSQIALTQSPPYSATEGEYVDQLFEKGSSGLFGSELGGKWKSKNEVLCQYCVIQLGYYLLGDDGVMKRLSQLRFRGSWRLEKLIVKSTTFLRNLLTLITKSAVPGWYDTHARHSSVVSNNVE